MAYGLKYILNYDGGPQGAEPYTLEFKFKDYTGTFQNVIGVQASVVHSWELDDPKAPVKGGNLTITLLNKNRTLPIDEFFSVADDTVMVIHKWKDQVLFAGFIVQDDCREPMLDYSHPITLSATDNLGLLKEVPFNEANALVGTRRDFTGTVFLVAGSYIQIVGNTTTGALVGDTMILNNPDIYGVYTINNVVVALGDTFIYVNEQIPIIIPSYSTLITLITPVSLSSKMSWAYIVRVCLSSTDLFLNCDVYATIIEAGITPVRFLETTFVSGNDFNMGNNNWKSCFDVLTVLLSRFRGCLFQSEGVWNFVRRDEHRYYNNAVPGFRYDSTMVYVEDITFDDLFLSAPNVDPSAVKPYTWSESAPVKSTLRPFKIVKETFNYKQPVDLLCNANFQKVGALLNEYTDGSNTVREYVMSCWMNGPFAPFPARFIRVTTDPFGTEISRYGVVTGATGSNVLSAQSEPVDVEGGETVKVSFSWRTATPHASVNNAFAVQLTDGVTTLYIQADGSWDTPIGINFAFADSGTWNNIEFPISAPIPFSGEVRMFLNDATYTSGEENWYSSISFQLKQSVSDSTNIIGQEHSATQQQNIKNLDEKEIFTDDSPGNSIQGTMFLTTSTGLLRDRTKGWTYPFSATTGNYLGYRTTFEQLFWRRIRRTKMEGTMYGLVQPTTRTLRAVMSFVNVDLPPVVAGIYVPADIFALLHVGDTFIISGTASNNGTFTVVSLGLDPFLVEVAESITLEPAINAFITLSNVPRHISMLTLIKYSGFAGKNFIFGLLTIDHKYNNFNGTFWEQWVDGEVDSDLTSNYLFKYLYAPR